MKQIQYEMKTLSCKRVACVQTGLVSFQRDVSSSIVCASATQSLSEVTCGSQD